MDDLKVMYAGLLCKGVRAHLFEIAQVLSGRENGVPFRLTSEQYASAHEAIGVIFHIVGAPALEPTASWIARRDARRDESFQEFLKVATTAARGRGRRG